MTTVERGTTSLFVGSSRFIGLSDGAGGRFWNGSWGGRCQVPGDPNRDRALMLDAALFSTLRATKRRCFAIYPGVEPHARSGCGRHPPLYRLFSNGSCIRLSTSPVCVSAIIKLYIRVHNRHPPSENYVTSGAARVRPKSREVYDAAGAPGESAFFSR